MINNGKIELIIGPVNSGKTTELIRLSRRYSVLNFKILVLKYLHNTNTNENIVSHNDDVIENTYNLKHLEDIILNNCKLLMDSDIILIDELHFFKDAETYIPMFANKYNKIVIAAGLDGNFNREPFVNVTNLIPTSDNVVKLKALCDISKDGSYGVFSHKVDDSKYLSLSREHYLKINNIEHNENIGEFTLIIGPMFSGKSTELIRRGSRHSMIGRKVIAINHSLDTRYSKGNICTHDKKSFSHTISIDSLKSFVDIYEQKLLESDVILIDELQFFSDSNTYIPILVEKYGKIVIASGLDGDFLQRPFGHTCDLVPFAENVSKLNSICVLSGSENASFTRRITEDVKQNVVGTNDKYISCSREIYFLPDEEFKKKYNDFLNN